MTNKEYRKLYLSSRNTFQITQQETMNTLRAVYRLAGERVSAVVRKSELTGSSLTAEAQRQIEEQLSASAAEISRAIEKEIPLSLSKAYQSSYAVIDENYLWDLSVEAGAEELITRTGIRNMITAVNQRLVRSMVNRVSQNGYTFSDKIWRDTKTVIDALGIPKILPDGIYGDFKYRIENVISAGFAQNRDLFEIAKDINVYIKDGKIQLLKRYGKLVRGTGEFTRRLSGRIDWRAVRLLRSELYASLQEAGVRQGELNPASTGLYDWIKTPGNPIDQAPENNASGFRCIDLESFNPYKRDDVPEYQHSNCSCSVVPVLQDRREFVSELKQWVNNGDVAFMNEWYANQYLPAQLAA